MATAKKKETNRLHGSHEVFHANDREVDIRSGFINCPKNPGHPNFHPFKDFRMEHIPEQHRTEDVYNWIRLSGELTIRVRASYVSEARPLHFADSCDEYPFAEHRGKRVHRFGTGFVTYVALEDAEEEVATSESERSKVTEKSSASKGSKGKRVRIAISSSTHVVFNEEETQGMKVDFFYDSKDKTQTQHIKTLHGPFKTALSTVVGDWFEFICHTEDFELFTKLNDNLNRVIDLEAKLSRDSTIHDIAAIISHPHGSYKHVTVGQLLPAKPFVTGGTISLSNVTFTPDNLCLFDRNSKLTFGRGSEMNLPHEMKMVFPDGSKFDLSPYKTECKVLTSFSFCPLQNMSFYGNQAVNWFPNIEYLCLCDSQFSCQTINSDSVDDYDSVIHVPKGTKFSVDDERPMQPGRRFLHFRHIESPVFCEELFIIKRLRFNAGTCPGSSGAKVLFLKNVPAVGFTHSEAFDMFNQSGPGFSCKCSHMDVS